MRIIVSLGLALLAFPAFAQTLVIPDNSGGGWVFGPTSQQSGPLTPDYGAGRMILTPKGASTIHPDGMGGGIVIDERGGVRHMMPDYGTGTHMIIE